MGKKRYIPIINRKYNGSSYQVKAQSDFVKNHINQVVSERFRTATLGEFVDDDPLGTIAARMAQEKRIEELKETHQSSKDLSEKLLTLKAVGNDPIAYALQRAKTSLNKKMSDSIDKGDTKSYFSSGGKLFAIETAEKMADVALQTAEASFNRYATLQEDYLTQQAISNVKDTISRVKSGASNILSGASTGAIFGPWGAAAGAVIGAISWGTSQFVQYQERISGYYQQLNATNYQTNFAASKLGLSGGSGTEN